MSFKPKLRKYPSDFERTFITDNSGALARSHRLIRIEQNKESQFMCLCSKIHLDEFKKNRSEKQREERRQKREKYQMI
jgi:hypothetical protein